VVDVDVVDVDVVDVDVVDVVDAPVRSGPATTTTSAVPIELIGTALLYGATALEGRCSDAAMLVASGWKPGT